MAKNWIVVANNTAARIFTPAPPAARRRNQDSLASAKNDSPPSRLVEAEKLEHSEGRLKSQAMDADRPGRSFQSAGMKRHAMSREVDPKKQAAIGFAKRIAERLESARRQGEVERLILVAAPELLGLMRGQMSTELGRLIEGEFSLDLVQMTPEEIRAHLPETLFSVLAR